MTPKIIWNKKALFQFEKAVGYIRLDSPQNADKVKKDILSILDSLIKYPERYPPDRDKLNNEKSRFRAFEKHRLRVSYYIANDNIIIIRVRHTKQNPQSY